MFCPKCGNRVPDGAKFCPSCGAPLAVAPRPPAPSAPQPQQPQSTSSGYAAPHPQPAYNNYRAPQPSTGNVPVPSAPPMANPQYRTMGGWLLFFLICYLITAIYAVVYGFQVFGIAGQLGYLASLVGMGWAPGILYAAAIMLFVCSVLVFYFCYLAFTRRPRFLRIYQVMGIVTTAMEVLLLLAYGSYYGVTSDLWANVIGSIVGLLLMTYYFCKSVRVRTYMGSEDYMDEAIFTLGR